MQLGSRFLVILLAAGAALGADGAAPVAVRADARGMELANGIIRMQIDATGRLTGLWLRDGANLLANGGSGYWNVHTGARGRAGFLVPGGPGRIVRRADGLVEVAFRHQPGGRHPRDAFAFDTELHYVLRRGESGFYLFITVEHTPDAPRATAVQLAYTLRLDPRSFDVIAVDDTRRGPSPSPQQLSQGERIMDATYRLTDGRVVTKYDFCHDIADDAYHVYGWASRGQRVGVWLVQPSAEYYGCTPFRQFISAHQTTRTPAIIWQPQCAHYGARGVECQPGEAWRKLYGPLFFLVNQAASSDALWRDARRHAGALAEQWPYRWMQHAEYAVERGEVTGQITLAGDRPAREAWVILSPQGEHWSRDTKGYHFWTRTDARGSFRIRGVRPGDYTLTATGADQFEEFERKGVAVAAGRTAPLGTLVWTPVVRGERLWQIGVADRSSGEFRRGDDYRHWGMWRHYPSDFPRGVRFVVGQSRESRDWNFAHWNWHCGDNPAWRIEFQLPEAQVGRAFLTVGVAASSPHRASTKQHAQGGTTDVAVGVNGREVGAIRLPYSGGAGHRSGRQTTPYGLVAIAFDAAQLRKGANTIALRHRVSHPYCAGDSMGERGAGPGYVMYDAIRLEVAPAREEAR